MKSSRALLYTLLSMFILVLAGTIPLLITGRPNWAITVVIGFLISFIYILFAYITIRHAFGKPATIFYRYMLGGMAFRFTFFLLSLLLLFKLTQLPIMGFVLSFVFFYIIFQIFEARLVMQEINNQKK